MSIMQSINDVQIFSAGTWNGDKYTTDDLDEMVNAFEANKTKVRPYLKLGHDENQELLQRDGLPAAGWIDRIYRVGDMLFANFVDIPKKIYDLIKNKAYRNVSSEIYWNIDINGTLYKRMLSAVALLGADTPAVMNLDDILNMYGLVSFETVKSYSKNQNIEIKSYSFDKEVEVNENEIKLAYDLKLQAEKLKETEDQAAALQAEKADFEKQIAELKEFKLQAEKDRAVAIENERIAKIEKFVTELEAEKLSTPAMSPILTALISGKTELSVGEKKYSTKEEMFKELLKLHSASVVNLKENSKDFQVKGDNKDEDDKLVALANKYMEENKCTFRQALKAVKEK